ncbi:ATP-dependent Clp protease ATP-binding subunit ClpA [Thiomicrorhabdus lithotrophica]|uniref:ATP-dependent Clp protease ATP-binding subunit ClpA n=1 Tax=Thiomicrorhabdus lithotrophica TaxID=2949997 RepID=A0ABY8CCE2_9GAMM|nr:ATP-dependent Clp protease ATP-binding subunit ClpA [Thiomicrorhabdus lithotrophica]WEJ63619.1 ATP-dependent Clp protease ATP-binding subunit ClpA [Thiomicrorhabdus lithotrophica]
MLSKELQMTLSNAFSVAHEYEHEFVTLEHLLLELLGVPAVQEVINACGADYVNIEESLEKFLESEMVSRKPDELQPTMSFQRVIERAIYLVQSNGYPEVTAVHVLASLYAEQDSQAVYLLESNGVERVDVLSFLSHGVTASDSDDYLPATSEGDEAQADSQGEPKKSPLESFTSNLNVAVEEGKIDPIIGREWELNRTLEVLSRRRKNNPLLVGEPGVGKTAVAEGLAYQIVNNNVPESLADAVVYSLDMGALLAGTRYRGDFEKRFKALLKALEAEPHAILFIDEIHTVIGAGAVQGGAMDASNLMKPSLSSGRLRCVGATTYEEYRGIFEKDRALARRFQKVDVKEPTHQESFAILKGLKSKYEEHHNVKYTLPALKEAVALSARYLTDRHLPDKAIDVIDEAGAKQALAVASKRKKQIGVHEVQQVVASIARIPVSQITQKEKDKLADLEANLKRVVFGQDHAVEKLTSAIHLARSGLNNPNKPTASFLFAGPTGVGKTELTQQLANHMGVEMLRFDMSEYMERHTVSRLIGAPPGYVGYDQGGLLTEAVTKNPHSVVLLDEIEKAHPDVFNLLLQVMDHGTLTDNNGRKADFRNITLIMTSNVGAEQMARSSMGFTSQDHTMDFEAELKKVFTPEFRNRLDGIIQFNRLSEESMESVVNKFIYALENALADKKVSLKISDAARAWLAKKGYDPLMGARPMERLIQEKVKQPLAEKLLFGELQQGGEVFVDCKDDELTFEKVEN